MLTLPGVAVQVQIYESANSLLYRGIREQDNQSIILKLLKENYPTPQQLIRYRTEYEITKSLNVSGVVQVYDLQKYQNRLVMLIEDFGGESLSYWMQHRQFTLSNFLQIAIKTTEALAQIHAANIIHKDINPGNLVFNPTTGQIKIIDFGISTPFNRENTTLKNPNGLEGTLAYLSPEQTGRMNRCVDYRSDFYSLGVTFYELLTHRLPFESTDPLELIHCHIAKQPIPPHLLVENLPTEGKSWERGIDNIPPVLSEIILKLMAKTGEERYQSAYGLKADLEFCWQQLQNTGQISPFPIALQDISDKFQLPQKLYGREAEIAALISAFEGARRQSQLMLIAGYSGIGKSALVQELYKPITAHRGYFISGKFDQYQRNIPYSALVRSLQQLIKHLLTESEPQLKQWQEKLLTALGVNGQVIVEVIPEIELIIGKQPPVPTLGPNESQNRFNLVFQKFIKVFTQPEHPLALFIDDLQWADGASLNLIQRLMAGAVPGLFLIGAYRDNEVSPGHPLELMVDEMTKNGAIIERISLSPLELPTIAQLIADTLKSTPAAVMELAELVQFKTGGNPFFMNEFLKSLYTEGLLQFKTQVFEGPDAHFALPDSPKNLGIDRVGWFWDLGQIKARNFTDNVVELMTGKIQKLPESTQLLVKLAACIGNEFDLNLLELVSQQSLKKTVEDLKAAVAENLVISQINQGEIELILTEEDYSYCYLPRKEYPALIYQFVHDRIQQAAYFLIPDAERTRVHRDIGQILLENTPPSRREEKLFDMVNQFNFALNLITESEEKYKWANLNLMAGEKAKLSAAYQPALTYLKVGIELLEEDSWHQHYPLTLSLYAKAAEVAYLNTDFELMDQMIEAVLSQAQTVLDTVAVYEVKILAYNAQSQFNEAIAIGLKVLKLLGINLPSHPHTGHVLWGLLQTKLALGFKPVASLVDLPLMTDVYPKAAMSILGKITSSAYFAAPLMFPLIVFKNVTLSIKWGNSSESAYAYSSYGVILCGVVGQLQTGYQFGQLCLQVLSQLNARDVKARTEFVVGALIQHWIDPLPSVLKPLLNAYQMGLENGDLEYAAYAACHYCYNAFLSGQELVPLESQMVTYATCIQEMGQMRVLNLQEVFHQGVLNLLGKSANPCTLKGTAFDEAIMLPELESRNDRTAICYVYFNKLVLSYLFGDLEQALNSANLCEAYLDGVTASPVVIYFCFYDSLIRLDIAAKSDPVSVKMFLKKVRENQKKLKKWARIAGMNNAHKFELIEAERYRVLGKKQQAAACYDSALELAQKRDCPPETALIYERAAKFYFAQRKILIAKAYLQESHYFYQLWGAVAKVKQLEELYDNFLTPENRKIPDTQQTISASAADLLAHLDISTMMKASQAIYGEIVLEKLLSSLMKIAIENAGAQRGCLILSHQGQLRIEAEGTIDGDRITVLQSIPLTESDRVAVAIVNYVARTQEAIVLNNATQEGDFTNDSYIQNNQIQSILCVPLIDGGKLVSIVYLENNRTTGAFIPERVEILKLLSGQAAISIQNAKLYSEVRNNEKHLAQLNQAYERFVPRQFLQVLDKASIVEVELGDQVQVEMSVLFSDIRDFTTLSESMTPEENFKFINSYLSRMEPAISEHSGFIDKYIGDAIMALFSGEADNAVKAGISMLHRLVDYNQHRANCGFAPIKNGIGINTGSLMLGTVGGENRMDGTVISDAVNLASRVEKLTKNYGVSLLITHQTYSRLIHRDRYAIRRIDRVQVKGKSQEVTVYEVFDADSPEIKAGKLATLDRFTEALSLFEDEDFLGSARLLAYCLNQNPGDRVAHIYFEQCQRRFTGLR
ncbi:AAA family ATPase [Oscillatoria sp. HE19RPO]|uniref:AAA family ATPase n=1 Tax=Oscillatoria sp. HE19RPO TaxID=2954806 RepID=UPI0020C3BFEB|nr:AAA family ATPase [Oscillatoria sp. HE19RPO]